MDLNGCGLPTDELLSRRIHEESREMGMGTQNETTREAQTTGANRPWEGSVLLSPGTAKRWTDSMWTPPKTMIAMSPSFLSSNASRPDDPAGEKKRLRLWNGPAQQEDRRKDLIFWKCPCRPDVIKVPSQGLDTVEEKLYRNAEAEVMALGARPFGRHGPSIVRTNQVSPTHRSTE